MTNGVSKEEHGGGEDLDFALLDLYLSNEILVTVDDSGC